MSDNPSLQELLEVQNFFGLPSPALVEKDWYVVKALAAIRSIDAPSVRLVFGGGTALSRAHRLIKRMSEDLDIRIVGEISRKELRELRETVTKAFRDAGFVFDPETHRVSRNESQYTLYRLPYPTVAKGQGALRPEIQIETACWPLSTETVDLSVISFIAEAFKHPPEVPSMPCVSLNETAADKFVALTRRAGEEFQAGQGLQDATLVRHLYDLHMLRAHFDPGAVISLARTIMQADAKAYANKFPSYRDNPVAATHEAVRRIKTDAAFQSHYAAFLREMVYGEQPEIATAFKTLADLAGRLSE